MPVTISYNRETNMAENERKRKGRAIIVVIASNRLLSPTLPRKKKGKGAPSIFLLRTFRRQRKREFYRSIFSLSTTFL